MTTTSNSNKDTHSNTNHGKDHKPPHSLVVYGMGYGGMTAETLQTVGLKLDACIVDIRMAPYSKNKSFTKKHLQQTLGNAYRHVPQFGNENYRNYDAPVQLADYPTGKEILLQLLQNTWSSAILLCGCRDAASCHRTVQRLQEDCHGLLETQELNNDVSSLLSEAVTT